MHSYNKRTLLIVGICLAFVGAVFFLRTPMRVLRSEVSPSDWCPEILQLSRQSRPSTAVNVFIPRCEACEFYLPVTIPGAGKIKMCTYDPEWDREISKYIKRHQQLYSSDDVGAMLKIMDLERSSDNQNEISLVDVGCNIGMFTLTAAMNGYKVLAVDAMNSSLQLLGTSLGLQKRLTWVTLVNNAIADAHGEVYIQAQQWNIGASRVVDRKTSTTSNIPNSTSGSQTVNAICLDDLVPFVHTHRVFLKMDIEGFEWKALRCADRFFTELDIPYIHMEWLFYNVVYKDKTLGEEIIAYLTLHGYTPYHPNGKTPLSTSTVASWPGNMLWIKGSPKRSRKQ